jgi:cell wall-associated NlpC family hydrolase
MLDLAVSVLIALPVKNNGPKGYVDRRQERIEKVISRAKRNRHGSYINGRWVGCMGFVRYSYSPVKSLPNYSGAMWNRGKPVSRKNLKPGDILLYDAKGSGHASIYLGRGRQIGANNHRVGVQIDRINAPWWTSRYAGARRVL